MSTYTDLHVRRKENLTILRMPGDPNDGITPQRVILANPENIYDGTFRGKIEVSSAEFNNVTLNSVVINGGVISAAQVYSNGQVIDIADLANNVDANSSAISGLQEQMQAAQISCKELDDKIADVNKQTISGITTEINTQLTALSDIITDFVDDKINVVNNDITALSSSINNDITALSSSINNDITALSSSINNDITALSSSISSSIGELNAVDHELSDTITKEISARTAGDTELENKISNHVNVFNEHVEENKQEFTELKNFFTEELKNKKHYKIVNKFEKVPYEVEDYAVNVINAGLTDYKIKYDQQVIGYGTTLKDGNVDKLKVSITTNNKIPALLSVIPGSYTAILEKGSGAAAGAVVDGEPVGGAYFYNIAWLDDRIQLDKVGDSYYTVKDVQYNTLIGQIVDAIIENGKLTSGRMLFNAGGKYNVFYEAFPNGWSFNNIDQVSAYSPSRACRIQFNANSTSFQFGFGVTTKRISEIKDTENTVFGKVFVEKTKKDTADTVSSIAVDGINLTKYNIQSIRKPNAILDSSNRFSCRLDTDLVLSAEVDQENAVFSVVKTKEKFRYPFYKPSNTDDKPDLSDATGFIIPDIENAKITDADVSFSVLSVQRVISGSLNTYECLSVDENRWEYSKGDKTILGNPWLTIQVINKNDTKWIVEIEGYSEDGQTYSSEYFVRPYQPQIIEETETYSLIAMSNKTNVVYGEQKMYPEEERIANITGPTSAEGEKLIVFGLEKNDASDLLIRVPAEIYYQNNTYAREFIVAAKITSEQDRKINFKLVDDDGNALKYYANGITYIPNNTDSEPMSIVANTWTAIRVTQVNDGMFEVEDLGYNKLKEKFSSIDSAISAEEKQRVLDDTYLSSIISAHTETINDLWKNIRGGLNYAGQIEVEEGAETQQCSIRNIIMTQINPVPEKLREGFFYVVKTKNKEKHYNLDGLEVEHGDWVIINKNCALSDVTSADVSIFDAQDYDNVKLNDENIITGKNKFTNVVDFTNTVNIHSTGKLSVTSDAYFTNGLSIAEGTLSAHSDAKFDGTMHVVKNATFDSTISANSVSASTIEVPGTLSANDISVGLAKKTYATSGFESNTISASSLSAYDAIFENNTVLRGMLSAHSDAKFDGTISASNISANSVSASSVSASSVSADSISVSNISVDSISASNISANSVSASSVSADSISASNVSADSISASNVSADSISASNISVDSVLIDSVSASTIEVPGTLSANDISVGLAKKTYATSGFESNTISASSLSAYDARITSAEITSANIASAKITKLSIELSTVMYSNATSSLQNLSNDIYGRLNGHDTSIQDLDNRLSNGMRFFGTLSNGSNYEDIHDFFKVNGLCSMSLQPGYCFRIGVDRVAFTGSTGSYVFHKNDYIVIGKKSTTNDINLSDINVIRDAYAEGISVRNQLQDISTILNANTYNLSVSLSDVVNTFSAIDKADDADITTTNMLVTDVIGSPTGNHIHKKYYMTFLSGTIVFKSID